MVTAALLLLADSRFPTGAHAHSAGTEASHGRGDIRTLDDLAAFVDGRLATTARTEAAFAAASYRPQSLNLGSATDAFASFTRVSAFDQSGIASSHLFKQG